MNRLFVSAVIAISLLSRVYAQTPAGEKAIEAPPPLDLSPPVKAAPIVPTLPSGKNDGCVEVEINGQSNYDCLNKKLAEHAQSVTPSGNAPPLDANSPSNAIGDYNRAAVQQQYGPNFGKSAIPYRPPVNYGGTLNAR